MARGMVQFPGAGCVVEFMQGNVPQIAWVQEEHNGKLRLLLPNRRELSLQANRLLPWAGPTHGGISSRDGAVELLERHRASREQIRAALDVLELWDMVQGDVDRASALWFAELTQADPDVDAVAACGQALLECKSHFKFQPPEFEIYPAAVVEARLAEQEATQAREALARQGNVWLNRLWESHIRRTPCPTPDSAEYPAPSVAEHLRTLLMTGIAEPENLTDDAQWRTLTKGLPEEPHLPLLLAQAWGLVPPHYNFWMDRADYIPGDTWTAAHADTLTALITSVQDTPAPLCELPFVSIDSSTTKDIDDAFAMSSRPEGGWDLHLALACPALHWPFDSPLGKAVLRRATSIYLPETTHHMLPEQLSTDAYSLQARHPRPALVLHCLIAEDGAVHELTPSLMRVQLAANLIYEDVEATLDGADTPATPHTPALRLGLALAEARQALRVRQGAVIIERPDLDCVLEPSDGQHDVVVRLEEAPHAPRAHLLVSELMILANAALARWGAAHEVPLLHRTQNVAVPKEYVGIWSEPQDIARVVRALAPACLETTARPHTGVGEEAYAPTTSPLRRYPDLINEAQVLHTLEHGTPRWSKAELDAMLPQISMRLEAAGQVQRQRPRYWKLLYIRQQGDKQWWDAVVTDENDTMISVSLPHEQLFLRARRTMFSGRTHAGHALQVRLGKVHPVRNEIQIAETREL